MTFGRERPVYAIGVVAREVELHPQTLRNYERWGLVVPIRSHGGTRYYSQRDVERILKIRGWMDDLGVNIAGVEVMLRLLERIGKLERQVNELTAELEAEKSSPGTESERHNVQAGQ